MLKCNICNSSGIGVMASMFGASMAYIYCSFCSCHQWIMMPECIPEKQYERFLIAKDIKLKLSSTNIPVKALNAKV